ncbi:LuxR C-terminal-related transcriptional regulator [Spirosoma sordidisoli]|uniref:Response regulator transcription factor n=1 Tax=Spirosoma sordidisoli TaxID=2502893 RepID=A0A4Q2UQ18_9BACT|nr:response regulator transcription factor [Spirosoma sordidisoli]RYC69720.1 response regulator transcription factor [Spirosoma sordidisoli]
MLTQPIPPGGILIAKQDMLLCETLKESLQARRLYVRGCITDGREALRLIQQQYPSLVILGAEMPGLSGIDIVRYIEEHRMPIKCIIYAKSRRPDFLAEALKLNVKGYLFVNSGFAELFYCVQEVLENREYVTPLAHQVVEELAAKLPPKPATMSDLNRLSSREREILCLIAQCFTNNQIADRICRSVATVNNHRHNIMKKLNLQGHHQLLPYALSMYDTLT